MNSDGNKEDGDNSEIDNSMHNNSSSTCTHVSKLHNSVVTW